MGYAVAAYALVLGTLALYGVRLASAAAGLRKSLSERQKIEPR